jgi:tRNA (guanine26-N2/guanine27-N2)-dimethyltransferase
MRTTTPIKEGTTRLFVYPVKTTKIGPGAKQKQPFYNPAMELNRDLSVVVGQWYIDSMGDSVKFLDGLAASGIRGIRLACEVEGDFSVIVNDQDLSAFSLIKRNIIATKTKKAVASNMDVNVLLSQHQFHSVDIDPFGPPVGFLDAAIRSIRHNGLLSVTATDTATLCGVYPKVCRRRYGAYSFHSVCMHEIGLRILLGFLCREAAKYDKGIQPLLCYTTDYYYRIYVLVRRGTRFANEAMKHYQMIDSQDFDTFFNAEHQHVGPLWTGKLQKKEIIAQVRTILFKKELKTRHKLWKLLSLLEDEANAPPFFYTTDSLASFLKISPPKLNSLFQGVQQQGAEIVKTHFSPTGFKTTATLEQIISVLKNTLIP